MLNSQELIYQRFLVQDTVFSTIMIRQYWWKICLCKKHWPYSSSHVILGVSILLDGCWYRSNVTGLFHFPGVCRSFWRRWWDIFRGWWWHRCWWRHTSLDWLTWWRWLIWRWRWLMWRWWRWWVRLMLRRWHILLILISVIIIIQGHVIIHVGVLLHDSKLLSKPFELGHDLFLYQTEAHGQDSHTEQHVYCCSHHLPLIFRALEIGRTWDNISKSDGRDGDKAEVGSLQSIPAFPHSKQQRSHEDIAPNNSHGYSEWYTDLLIFFIFIIVVVVNNHWTRSVSGWWHACFSLVILGSPGLWCLSPSFIWSIPVESLVAISHLVAVFTSAAATAAHLVT